MTHEMIRQSHLIRNKDYGLWSQHSDSGRNRVEARSVHFLTLLQDRFGYTKAKAIDELERLLKLFYSEKKRIGIPHIRAIIGPAPVR
jgi:hypothetical protein